MQSFLLDLLVEKNDFEQTVFALKEKQKELYKKAYRKGTNAKIALSLLVTIALIRVCPDVLTSPLEDKKYYFPLLMLLLLAILLILIWTMKSYTLLKTSELQQLKNEYKTRIFALLCEKYPEIHTSRSNAKIAIEHLQESGLFSINNQKYWGNDYFAGYINPISFEICEISLMQSFWKFDKGIFIVVYWDSTTDGKIADTLFCTQFQETLRGDIDNSAKIQTKRFENHEYIFIPFKKDLLENNNIMQVERLAADVHFFSKIMNTLRQTSQQILRSDENH